MQAQQDKLVGAIQTSSAAAAMQMDGMQQSLREAGSAAQKTIAEHAARQERANRMLDNIQRRRVPPHSAEY